MAKAVKFSAGPLSFTPALLRELAAKMVAGEITDERLTLSDSKQPGLRAIIRSSGAITLHAHYRLPDGTRPWINLGPLEEMSIGDARKLTATVTALARTGVDPLESTRAKVMKELLAKGTAWRP